ncbi:hypothetical protein DEU35_1748 [Microbacterium sp. AG157]|uniref:Tetratricopeptide repeat protein n=1 Tax=Microbacterium testaceum TaxID=2033 RepID=A0A4Y3QME4_MICTE|nr:MULTISPECIES: hypothetical protein [Microbacterium]REC98639.1 hypothetical protein DEU35_1748 [Microbacterium sp. AG157]GEB46444.1 hypothetical protein MTE01_23890 [Microbacterium testaceum]
MTAAAESIRALFDEIDRTPWGPRERALVAEAVARAQESGDARLEYEARLRQTSSANMIGDTDLMLTSFAWCLAQHDADPERFPAELEPAGDLLWQYKWMAGALRGSPEFSSEQIDAVLDDMEEHYHRAGVGPSGAMMARFEDAWAAGRIDEAAALRERLEATPRDEYSHCDACVRSQFAGFFAETGREDETIRLVEEMVEGGFTCGEEPERALALALLPLLRAGRLDQARAFHLRSYRLARENPDNLTIIADNVVFCALTGNEARALSLVEKHLRWLAHDGLNAEAHQEAFAAFALALDAVTRAGHGDTPVRGSDAAELAPLLGGREAMLAASELASLCWARADEIAAAFDRRNGNDAHARRLERTRALEREHYDVPLSSSGFSAPAAAPRERNLAERIERAQVLAAVGTPTAIDALADVLDDADAADRVTLTFALLRALVAEARHGDAAAVLEARVEALRALGRDDRADIEAERGPALFGVDDEVARRTLDAHPDAPADLTAHLLTVIAFRHLVENRLDDALDASRRARDLYAREGDIERTHALTHLEADVRRAADEPERALEVLDALLSEDTVAPGRRVRLLMDRATIQDALGEPRRGADDADEAARLLLVWDVDDHAVASALSLGAQLAERAGENDRAVAGYRVALQRLEATGEPTTGLLYGLGRALLAAGAPHEAIEVIDDVLERETAANEAPGSRAITVGLLARAFEHAEEWGNALRAWEITADLHVEAEEPARRASALVARAHLLGRLGEEDEAVETLTTAVAAARTDPDNRGMLADALHSLAQAKAQRGDDDALAMLDEALEIGRADEAGWLVADLLDTRARILGGTGRIDEAVANALQAADGFLAAGGAPQAGASELLAARILRDTERIEEAAAVLRSAHEHAEGQEQLRQAIAIDLGDALEALGRHGEAAEVRSTLRS